MTVSYASAGGGRKREKMKIPEVMQLKDGEAVEVDITVKVDKFDSAALRLLDVLYKGMPDDATYGDAENVIRDMAWWNTTFNIVASDHGEKS